MLNLTRLHLGIAHESQFQGLGIRHPWGASVLRPRRWRRIANLSSLEAEPSGPLEIVGVVLVLRLGHWGNGPNLLVCSHAAPRSARCSKDATPLSRSIGGQDRIVARVRRGGHIRPGLAVFRPRCYSCHCRGQRCGRCRGNHQIVPLFRTRAALGSASVLHEAGKWCACAPFPITGCRAIQKVGPPTFLT
jgi:hypothetical protein